MLAPLKNSIKQLLVPKSKLVILNYHQLGETLDPKVHNKHIWNNVAFFKEQMAYLKENYQIVTLKEGVERLQSNNVKETIVCLTFDDGDISIANLAMPLLEQLNIPATFFINTSYGNEKLGYWYNLGPYFDDKELIEASKEIRNTTNSSIYNRLLEFETNCNSKYASEVSPFYSDYNVFRNCKNPLFHFGLHGHEHLRFSMLPYQEQKQNLLRNIDAMRNWPNYLPYFAIPFGQPRDWNDNTIQLSSELNVIPFLAFQGYNTVYRTPLLRFSVDGMDLRKVFRNFSPFQKTYDKLNNLIP